jgi:hypothetical protein
MSRRKTLPPWTDDAAVRAWVHAELDKANDASWRDIVEGAKHYVRSLPQRSSTESRKRALTIGKHAGARHRKLLEQRAIEAGDIDALRRLNLTHAQFINLPNGKSGRPRSQISNDPLSPEARLEEATYDISRIRDLLKRYYRGKVRRPRGATSVTQMAAERWGLDKDDIARRRVSPKTRERLARQR